MRFDCKMKEYDETNKWKIKAKYKILSWNKTKLEWNAFENAFQIKWTEWTQENEEVHSSEEQQKIYQVNKMKGFWFVLSFWFQWQWLVHFEMMMLQKWEKHFKIEMFFKLNFLLLVWFSVTFKLEISLKHSRVEQHNHDKSQVNNQEKRKFRCFITFHFDSINNIFYLISTFQQLKVKR